MQKCLYGMRCKFTKFGSKIHHETSKKSFQKQKPPAKEAYIICLSQRFGPGDGRI